MNNIYQHYIIDLSSNNNFVQIPTVQGDGNNIRGFEVELIENGVQYEIDKNDCLVAIMGTKPDTSQIMNDCTVSDEGYILVDITSQMSAVKGRGDYQIVLMSRSTNSQLKSFPFYILTTPAAFDIDHIVSSDEFQALTRNIVRTEEVIEESNDTISDMRALEESVEKAEKARVDAEEKRVNAENIRISNEETRQDNETIRQDNETVRQSNETMRESSEDTRQSNESDRQIAETARDDAENIRIQNEFDREQAETIRINAETDRVNAEDVRETNENIRIENENARKIAEDSRMTEETRRDNAESIRIDNESVRQTNESVRESNESDRQTNTALAISNAEEATNRANVAAAKATLSAEGIDIIYQQATGYTDQKIADLINGAPSTLDTLGEIAQAMEENADVVEALEQAVGSKASQAEVDGHIGNNTVHITTSEREKWNTIEQVNAQLMEAEDDIDSLKDDSTNIYSTLNALGRRQHHVVSAIGTPLSSTGSIFYIGVVVEYIYNGKTYQDFCGGVITQNRPTVTLPILPPYSNNAGPAVLVRITASASQTGVSSITLVDIMPLGSGLITSARLVQAYYRVIMQVT